MNLVRGRCTSVGSKCVRRVWRIVRWTWREAGREKGSVWGISLERPHCIYFGGEISFIGLRLTCGPIYWGLHVRHYMLCRLNWCKFIISSTERGGTLCEVPYIKLFFETLETSESKNSRTIWQHVILLLHSKWFEVQTIYFYGPFLLNQIPFPLKHPTKSRSKWGELNKKACSGNTRKLVLGRTENSGRSPTYFRLVLAYI